MSFYIKVWKFRKETIEGSKLLDTYLCDVCGERHLYADPDGPLELRHIRMQLTRIGDLLERMVPK